MKKTFAFFLFCLLLITNPAKSQNITGPAATIEALLCKKWVTSYGLIGNVKEDIPTGHDMIEFKKDKTFTMLVADKTPYSAGGTWKYDPGKKIIKLIIRGTVGMIITDVTEKELTVMFAGDGVKAGSPESRVKIIYIVKAL